MPVIAGTTIVETVKPQTAIVKRKDRRITITMGTVKRAFLKLVLGPGANGDFLYDTQGVIFQKLLQIKRRTVMFLCFFHSDIIFRRMSATLCTSSMELSSMGSGKRMIWLTRYGRSVVLAPLRAIVPYNLVIRAGLETRGINLDRIRAEPLSNTDRRSAIVCLSAVAA